MDRDLWVNKYIYIYMVDYEKEKNEDLVSKSFRVDNWRSIFIHVS